MDKAAKRSMRSPTWEQQDLVRRLCHALDIASLAIQHLAPAGYKFGDDASSAIRREKPIAETAVLLYATSIVQHNAEVHERMHRIARELEPHARSREMRLGLALNTSLALDYSIGHILLSQLGYPDPTFDALLQQSLAAQGHAGHERTPHRAMEQQWLANLCSTSPIAMGPALRSSILSQPMDLFGASDSELYAFTHAIMYATGFRRNLASLPRSRGTILAEAESAIARCLDGQDYDLSAEILLAWPLTGKRWSPAATFAFQVLTEVEDKAGFLPTPATRVSELKTREGTDRSQYLLATAYHTAYTMGLLCAAALQPGCAPPASIARRKVSSGAAQQMLRYLDDGKTPPHWRETFDKLNQHQAQSLAGFLFNIALQRRVAGRDFAGLNEVLRHGYNLGLADIPAASQAAELLQRVATVATPSPSL